jgi:gliding motility-associated-like protein
VLYFKNPKIMQKILFFTFLLLSQIRLYAQPSNDDCDNPIILSDVTSWCSNAGAYNNNGATPSNEIPSFCSGGNWSNDVWFQFTAEALALTVSITTSSSTPYITLYSNDCANSLGTHSLGCKNGSTNTVDLFKEGLIPGETYLIQVSTSSQTDFQVCINNYNAPATPGSDCVTASLLCDKSPFTVQSITSAGNVRDEARGTCLGTGSGQNSESSSTWFKWVCDQPGTLTFTLSPNNPLADLDFVVWELDNGINNCDKTAIRCNAAGGDGNNADACSGPTGLSLSANDLTEPPGCTASGQSNDKFVKYIDMVVGRAYALMVNNYSGGGSGFRIDFGGTGTFLGPKPDFTVTPLRTCIGNPITITDQSVAGIGTIVGNTWAFGSGAQPSNTASGAGPHTISYNYIGTKPIVHIIRSSEGCVVTKTIPVIIDTLAIVPTIIPPTCGGGQDGGATIVVTRGIVPYVYTWSNGSTTPTIQNVPEGIYTVTVSDAGTCTQTAEIPVSELELIAAANTNSNPLCYQTPTGNITIQITNGDPPYSFDFGNTGSFQSNPIFNNLTAGSYTVTARDGNNCTTPFTFVLTDPPLLMVTKQDSTNLKCYQDNSGSASIRASGGTPTYQYVWNNLTQNTQNVTGLNAGIYTITVTDSNQCTKTATFALTEPAPIAINRIYVRDSPCFGQNKGSISVVEAAGGTLPYQFSIGCTTYQSDSILKNLFAGTYTVCIKDIEGCSTSATATVKQPLPIYIDAGRDVTIDLGESTSLSPTTIPLGSPGEFSWLPPNYLSCILCKTTQANPVNTTTYTVKLTNDFGCIYSDSVTVFVNPVRPVYIPNVFTPNGDGKNDIFQPFSNGSVRNIKSFKVFDRWGEQVFEAHDAPIQQNNFGTGTGWDGTFKGKPMNPGVFVYLIEFNFIDGSTEVYKGDMSLLY